jgi:hypothetical protein
MTQKSLNRQMKMAGFTDPNDPLTQLAMAELGKIAKQEQSERKISDKLDAEEKRLVKEMKNKPDTCWDDLNDIHDKFARVFQGYAFMAKAMNDKEMLAYVVDKKTFSDNVRLLHHDLKNLRAEFDQIYAMHKGRTGGKAKGIAGDKELIAALEVNEHYQVWIVKHDQICERTSAQIRAAIHEAEARMLAAQQAKQAAEAPAAETATDAAPAIELIERDGSVTGVNTTTGEVATVEEVMTAAAETTTATA